MASLVKRLIGILRGGVPDGDWTYEDENLLYCIDGEGNASKVMMKGGWYFVNSRTGKRAYLTGKDDGSFYIPANQLKVELEEADEDAI